MIYNDYCSWYIKSENTDSQNTRQHWQRLVHKYKTTGADIVRFEVDLFYFSLVYIVENV